MCPVGAGSTGAPITPARILDAAARLFRQHGYEATRTRELAAALGVQKGSLYYYVEKKEDILFEICLESLRRLQEAVDAALRESDDPERRLLLLITTHTTSILRDRDLHATMLLELRSLSGERRRTVVAQRDAYEQGVRRIVGEAQEAGVLREDVDARQLTFALFNLMNWTVTWFRPQRAPALTPPEFADLLASIFLDGARGPRPQP